MSTIKKAFKLLFKNWVLCVATGLSTLTAIANTNTFGSENNTIANFMIFSISFSGLYMIRQAKASDDLLKLFYYSVAAVIALVSCLGSANYLMSKQNSDFQQLIAAERAVKNADNQVVTAKVMLSDCERNHYKDCIKINSAIVLEKETKYNTVFEKYNAMATAQNKSEIAAFNAKTFGLDTKQFMFAKWLVVSFLFGLVEYLFWIGSSSKPQALHPTETQADFTSQLTSIIEETNYTELEKKCMLFYKDYEEKGEVLTNGLPSSTSKLGAKLYGVQSSGNTLKAHIMLVKLGLVGFETIKLEG